MKTCLVIFLSIVLISISMQQSDVIQEIPQDNNQNKTSNNTLTVSLTNYTGDAISIALDFIPYVSNIKNLGEAVLGVDLVTGQNLTIAERILSLVCVIPFANYLKGGKSYKVGHSFLKASERAFAGGKMRNFIKFGKASVRAFAKPNNMQKIAKAGTLVAKGAKSLSKAIRKQSNNSPK